MCLPAVYSSGDFIEYVREDLKTHEMILFAVTNNGHALKFVPENLQTPEICLKAIQNNPYSLAHVHVKILKKNPHILWKLIKI